MPRIMRLRFAVILFSCLIAMSQFVAAQTGVRHIQEDDHPIATAVWAGDTLLSQRPTGIAGHSSRCGQGNGCRLR